MNKIKLIIETINWILRIVLFSYIIYVLLESGINIIYSLVYASLFMLFWTWLMWGDDVIKPINYWKCKYVS